MTIAIRVEETKNVSTILKKGIKGKKHREHPIAKEFEKTTFLYPIDGLDQHLHFWPKNAKMKDINIDDNTYVIADVDNCFVGDLYLEDKPKEYLDNTTSLKKYTEKKGSSRYEFEEPEIVCTNDINQNKILGTMSFTKLDAVYKKCKKLGGNQYTCIELGIKEHIKK